MVCGVIEYDESGIADWMLYCIQLHLLHEVIHESAVMLPETIETYHIQGGDVGTWGTCRNKAADVLSVCLELQESLVVGLSGRDAVHFFQVRFHQLGQHIMLLFLQREFILLWGAMSSGCYKLTDSR